MTCRGALLRLYAVQHWLRVPLPKDGKPYAPGFFLRQKNGFISGIGRESRQGILRLIYARRCVAHGCETIIPENSAGDHLIPVALGGRNYVANFVPLCRPHNSSKGKKDLLEWWVVRQWPAVGLPLELWCHYCRLNWQLLSHETLSSDAPLYLVAFLEAAKNLLPSDGHRKALDMACSIKEIYVKPR